MQAQILATLNLLNKRKLLLPWLINLVNYTFKTRKNGEFIDYFGEAFIHLSEGINWGFSWKGTPEGEKVWKDFHDEVQKELKLAKFWELTQMYLKEGLTPEDLKAVINDTTP